METINVRLYEIFRQDFKLSDIKAKELTQAVEAVAKEKSHNALEAYKSAVREDFLRLEMKIEQNKSDLELKMEQTKTELLKWFIGGFITIAVMLIGLFATIVFKK